MTAFTITVQWEMVPCTAQNGEIIGHIVYYWETEYGSPNTINVTVSGELSHSDTMDKVKKSECGPAPDMMGTTEGTGIEGDTVSVSGQQVTLTGLRPSTTYSVTVAAYNEAGIGQQSQPLLMETSGEFHWLRHCKE